MTTTASAGSKAPKKATCWPAPSLMPAMPPPDRPCGRTPEAGKWSSWASVEMKQSSSSPVASSTAPTTSSPSLRPMTSHSSRPSTSGLTRLTMPSRVPSARPGPSVGERREREGALAGVEGEDLAQRQAALEVGVVGRVGQLGHVEDADLDQPAAVGQHADLAAGGGPYGARHHVVVGAALARGRAAPRRSCGRAGRWTTGARSRGRRRPRATWRAVTVVPAEASRTVRRGVPCSLATSVSSSETTFRSSFSSARIASRCSIVRSSSSFSLSSSSLENFVSRRSGMSRM